jgi:hypothetical protein
MCYFSAEGHSREAREDEALVVGRQPHGANCLVSSEDASTPVCLRTGTEVELLYIPEKTATLWADAGGNRYVRDEPLVAARSVCSQKRSKSASEETTGVTSGKDLVAPDRRGGPARKWSARGEGICGIGLKKRSCQIIDN